jgi:hypothetical protein
VRDWSVCNSRKVVVPNVKEKDEVGGNDPRQRKMTMEKAVFMVLAHMLVVGSLVPEPLASKG